MFMAQVVMWFLLGEVSATTSVQLRLSKSVAPLMETQLESLLQVVDSIMEVVLRVPSQSQAHRAYQGLMYPSSLELLGREIQMEET